MLKPNHAMVFFLSLFATLLFGCSVTPAFSKPSVSISSPPNGAQVPMGQEVLVQAVANDTASIARVELWVDGMLNAVIQPTSRQAPYSAVLRWTPTLPGVHTLVVKAVNINSLTSEPATIAITVTGSRAAASTPTAPPSVTLSPPAVTPSTMPTLPTSTLAVNLQASPFTGSWQGPDPDDGSTISLSLVQSGNALSGTFSDTFSRNILPPGFHGNGSGTILSATASQITFNLTRWDGVSMQFTFSLTLSNQDNTLTLDCSAGCPIVLQRR